MSILFHPPPAGHLWRPGIPPPTWRQRQTGATLIEFLIVVLPLSVLGLGSIELAGWIAARQIVSVALLDAGRAGISSHNHPDAIHRAFEVGLRPLYAGVSATQTTQRLQRALQQRQADMGTIPWRIQVLSPSASAYTDFSDDRIQVAGASSQHTINNNYLAEQHQHHLTRGWKHGRGPVSGQTIYEANSLVLQLDWLHEPRLPLIKPVLRALGMHDGSYRQRAWAQGYLVITRQITLVMQSHPVHWESGSHSSVQFEPSQPATATPPCKGWLCTPATLQTGTTPLPVPAADLDGPPPPGGNHSADTRSPNEPVTGPPGAHPPGRGQGETELDDPACGVTLCCV